MIQHFKSRCGTAAALSKPFWALLLLLPATAHATNYIWDGSTDFWNSLHWNPGLVAGPTLSTDTATINSGRVTFFGNDTFSDASTVASPLITINSGGTLASGGNFNTMWNLTMNGGTLLANGGVNNPYGSFGLKGTVTVGGSSVSTIAVGGVNGFETVSVGHGTNGNTTFNVADVTSSAAADLIVNAVLNNNGSSSGSGLIKTGAGTMQLNAMNTYPGNTLVSGGTLDITSTGGLNATNLINTTNNGLLNISGNVTVANNGVFAIGSGNGTAGTVVVNSGAALNIGNGAGATVGATLIGGKIGAPGTAGSGTLTINGGAVNVAAAGTGASSLDGTRLWLNPYGGTGSVINLNGGTLTTARSIANGTGASTATVNFGGGTLRAGAAIELAFASLLTGNVLAGGAIIDTNTFNATLSVALLNGGGGGGLTKNGNGQLTLATNASTFTGNVVINSGSVLTSGSANTATPTATSLGNMTTVGKTITLAAGTSLTFGSSDTIGSTTSMPATIILNNATLSHGTFFNTLGNVTLNDGSTLTGGNGVNAGFQTFNLRGSVTVSGTGASFINTTGTTFTGVHLGVTGPNDFIVSSTGSAADLTVSVPLMDRPGGTGAGQLRKTGAGTMVLTAANTYTSSTLVNEGTLEVNAGSISGPGLIDIGAVGIGLANFKLTAGSVTAGGQFVVGAHGSTSTATHTAGALQVNGTIYLGGYAEGTGTGTYTQNGGTVTTTGGINFGGGGPNHGVYNLNGGTLTTPILSKNGSGTANFNFNGGTLVPTANSTTFLQGLTAATVQAGGGTVNTNGFNVTIAQALLNGGGGITKTGNGILTLSSNASTFIGNVNITGGTVALTAGLLGPATTTSALGNPTVARTITVGAGARLEFKQHDILGNDGANPQLNFVINGGTLAAVPGSQASGNGPFNILPSITLNGGTLTSANGAFPSVQSWSLKGDVIVSGSIPSMFNTTGTAALLNGSHLTKVGGVTFDVANVTGDAATDFSVSAPLIDRAQGGAGSLIKAGAGTMALEGLNTYTGATTINGGTLLLGVTNALPATAALNLSTGATLNTGGFSNNTGALSVNGVANIDTAAGTGTLTFTAVTAWSAMLNVWNYTGAPWTLGTDKITFTNVAGIDFNNVNFYSGPVGNTASLIGTGGGGLIGNELVPVPEPGAAAGGLVLLGVIARRERRRRLHSSR